MFHAVMLDMLKDFQHLFGKYSDSLEYGGNMRRAVVEGPGLILTTRGSLVCRNLDTGNGFASPPPWFGEGTSFSWS